MNRVPGARGTGTPQRRHHMLREQPHRAPAFVEREIAEGELADHVIRPSLVELRAQPLRDARWRARKALAARDQRVEVRRPRVLLRAAVQAKQVGEGIVPLRIGAALQRQRLAVGLRHHDEAPEPELGQGRVATGLAPGRPIAVA